MKRSRLELLQSAAAVVAILAVGAVPASARVPVGWLIMQVLGQGSSSPLPSLVSRTSAEGGGSSAPAVASERDR